MTQEIDVVNLIACVLENPPLWDKKHKFYKNRSIIGNCWSEISRQMNYDEFKLRKKWRCLRDQFAIELGKQSLFQEDECKFKPKWPYYNSLLFLKGIVTPRILPSFTRPASPLALEVGHEDSEYSDTQSLNDQLEQDNDDSEPICTPAKRIKRSSSDIEQENVQCLQERQKEQVQHSQTYEEDENMLFFKSILPHVRKIPSHNLLSFRNRINDIVQEFAYRDHGHF